MRVTQVAPATGPANTTLPAAGARTSSPTGASMSIPRCPGPYGPARASNPRTTGPVTGIHNPGTRGDGGVGCPRAGTLAPPRPERQRPAQRPRPPRARPGGTASSGGRARPLVRDRPATSDPQAIGRDGVVRTAPDATGRRGPADRHPRECGEPVQGRARCQSPARRLPRRLGSRRNTCRRGDPAQPVPRTPGRSPPCGAGTAQTRGRPMRPRSSLALAGALLMTLLPGTAMATQPTPPHHGRRSDRRTGPLGGRRHGRDPADSSDTPDTGMLVPQDGAVLDDVGDQLS